jgi:hypothetical protein
MSDAARLQNVVLTTLLNLLPDMQEDNRLTLAYMIVGLILGRNVQLAKMAEQVNYPHKESSLEDRFRRFVNNNNIEVTFFFFPFVECILAALSQARLVFSMDTTKNGGNCITLMMSVRYKSRALPICWLSFKGKKGHSSQVIQLELIKMVNSYLPTGCQAVFLGDGEFDGSEVVAWLETQEHWQYVCRTAKDIKVYYQEEWIALQDLPLKPGQDAFFPQVSFTEQNQVGPVNIMAVWNVKEKEHWFFVTDFETLREGKRWYKKRFTIETLFSDVKSRGFDLEKSHLKKPQRADRLLLAVAIAYIFIVFWGVESILTGDFKKMIRTDRFEHSLFRLGLKYITHLLKKCRSIPMFSGLPPPNSFEHIVLVT